MRQREGLTGVFHAGDVESQKAEFEWCDPVSIGGCLGWSQSQYGVTRTEGWAELLVTSPLISHPALLTVTPASPVLPQVEPLPHGLLPAQPLLQDVPALVLVEESVVLARVSAGDRLTPVLSLLPPYQPLVLPVTTLVAVVRELGDVVDVALLQPGGHHNGPAKEEQCQWVLHHS